MKLESFIDYIEKEVPQPQVETALGFSILKYEPIISDVKSTFEPLMISNEVLSIIALLFPLFKKKTN